jgi:hypothetical protein
VLESRTASGPGWHRYGVKASGSTDGYGDCYKPDPTHCALTGKPWFAHAVGSGHLWPVLDGERAEQDLHAGDYATVATLAVSLQHMTWGLGYVRSRCGRIPTSRPRSTEDSVRVATTVAGSNGAFKVTVPVRSGANVITATATAGRHATGWAQVRVTGAKSSGPG